MRLSHNFRLWMLYIQTTSHFKIRFFCYIIHIFFFFKQVTMADQVDAVTMATILRHVSNLIFLDKMGLALGELRGIIDDLFNNNHPFQYLWNNNRFNDETVAFI